MLVSLVCYISLVGLLIYQYYVGQSSLLYKPCRFTDLPILCSGLVYWGLAPQQQPASYKGDDDDDESLVCDISRRFTDLPMFLLICWSV